MRQITEDDIKRLCGTNLYNKALIYYQLDQVEIYDAIVNDEEARYYAKVFGTDVYETIISIIGDQLAINCSCPTFKKNMMPCEHITALMYAVQKGEDDILINPSSHEENSVVNTVINHFSSNVYENMEKAELQTHFILTIKKPGMFPYDNDAFQINIKMKIGTIRSYVIKNIYELLDAIEENTPLKITNNFTFTLKEQTFSEPDLKVIQTLQDILINQETNVHPYNFRPSKSKELSIPLLANEVLLENLKNCQHVTIEDGGDIVPFEVVENEFPNLFSLVKRTNSYFLKIPKNQNNPVPVPLADYYYYKGVFFHTNDEDSKNLAFLYDCVVQNKGEIHISHDQLEKLAGTGFLRLMNEKKIKVEQAIKKDIEVFPLQAVIHLDYTNNQLIGKISAQYGKEIINPLLPKEKAVTDRIIVRDIDKEYQILSQFNNFIVTEDKEHLICDDEGIIFDFLYEKLPILMTKADIFLTDPAKNLIVEESQKPTFQLDLNQSSNFLEIGFKTDDISDEDLVQLLQSVVERRKYHKLANGALLPIEQGNWTPITRLLDDDNVSLKDFKDQKLQLPSYRALQIEGYFEDADSPVKKGKNYRKLIREIRDPEILDTEIPTSLEATLRDYQERGFYWLKTLSHYNFGGILADDMGLGKTVQAISYMLSEHLENKEGKPHLVVSPASLIYNWEKELTMFAPKLRVEVVEGSKQERLDKLSKMDETDVFITSYPLIRRDGDDYGSFEFGVLILDEAQAFKNPTSQTFKVVRDLRATHRFALSGTPIENKIEELWSLFAVVMPGFFKNKRAFQSLSEEDIRKRISPFILRRTKKEVLKELPDKIEIVRHSELLKSQRELYVAYLKKIQSETLEGLNGQGFDKSRMKILAGLTRLRQLCCHPSLFIENYEGTSGKLEELLTIVEEGQANNNRILIFSQFTTMLKIIQKELDARGLNMFYLDGTTKARDRLTMVDQFNAGEKDVFLISLKAGGTGLNLTGADTVVLFDLWWNPAVEQQAADRAHRMGQKKVVQVIKLVTKGTIEEKIALMQEKKKELFDKVIQSGETPLTTLSEDDIRELLSL